MNFFLPVVQVSDKLLIIWSFLFPVFILIFYPFEYYTPNANFIQSGWLLHLTSFILFIVGYLSNPASSKISGCFINIKYRAFIKTYKIFVALVLLIFLLKFNFSIGDLLERSTQDRLDGSSESLASKFNFIFAGFFIAATYIYGLLNQNNKYSFNLLLSLLCCLLLDLTMGGRGYLAAGIGAFLIAKVQRVGLRGLFSIKILSLISLVLSFFIAIGVTREGDISVAIEQLFSYISHPLVASAYLIDKHDMLLSFPNLQDFIKILPIINSLSGDLIAFDYVPIYQNSDLGFNSFTWFTYILGAFGVFSYFIFLLLGFVFSWSQNITNKHKLLIKYSIMFICLFSFRDFSLKWSSLFLSMFYIWYFLDVHPCMRKYHSNVK